MPSVCRSECARQVLTSTEKQVISNGVVKQLARLAAHSGGDVEKLERVLATGVLDVLRERGELYQALSDGTIGNQYRLRVLNKSQHRAEFQLATITSLPVTVLGETNITAEPGELLDIGIQLSTNPDDIRQPNAEVQIELCETATNLCVRESTRFLGPTR